jgi:hypothetical protein
MMKPWLRTWLGTSLLGSILIAGCQHASKTVPTYTAPRPAIVLMPPAPVSVPVVTAPVAAPEPTPPAPQVVESNLGTLPPAAPPPVEEKKISPASYTLTGAHEEPIKRRTFNDITANPAYGHAPDYGWLIGELQFLHVRNAWRLRYASVDEEDRYGGSVTLTEIGSMNGYADGQLIRVEGHMADPESREPSPAYRVRSMQIVSPR